MATEKKLTTAQQLNFKDDFSMLRGNVNGARLVYLDSSATSLKPQKVVDKVVEFYTEFTSNVARGDSLLSEITTLAFEDVRSKVADYIGANYHEIVFTMNASDALNKIPLMLKLSQNDRVITTLLEHHSNYLPWITRCNATVVDLNERYDIDIDYLVKNLSSDIKLVAVTMGSNVTGNLQQVEEIVALCRSMKIPVVVDATQVVGHKRINVKELGCDFLVFSAHKMLGPSGVGVLYINDNISDKLCPAFYGGGMVAKIDKEITFKTSPFCFETGTPAIENVLGFGAALDYLVDIGIDKIEHILCELNDYAYEKGSRLLSFFYICQEERTNEFIEIAISMIKSTLGLL